jgi:hypothetical protein
VRIIVQIAKYPMTSLEKLSPRKKNRSERTTKRFKITPEMMANSSSENDSPLLGWYKSMDKKENTCENPRTIPRIK